MGSLCLGLSVGPITVEGLSKVTGFSNTDDGAVLPEGAIECRSNETGFSKIDAGWSV